jgi:para-aminobenzoate synthetase component 1
VSRFASPLVAELTLPPWHAFRALAGRPQPLFLDSSLQLQRLGRYSYVTADPCRFIAGPASRWREVVAALAAFHQAPLEGLPPFQGGIAGLFGYDLCHQFERLPRPRIDEFRTPDLAIGLYDWVYAFDHERECGWVISTGYPEMKVDPRQRRAAERLERACQWLTMPVGETMDEPASQVRPIELPPQHTVPGRANITSNFSRPQYEAAVQRAIDYIHAGDCFQVNIAQRLVSPLRSTPFELYQRLRERNPAPFSGYFDLGECVIASASPERFLYVGATGEVETRPIKGTRPRGRTPDEDRLLANDLRTSAKDRAENIMIVDLLRNDLGRVCDYGSISVPALCEVETYATVHHLVSQVRGKLRPGKSPLDLLRAAFPGGSVTGAPKIRAMEIIAELEPTARGPYCGALGFVSFTGAMDTNILIRTFTFGKGWVQFPVGGGIVADSEPEREYLETLHKAAGMLRALE